MSVSYLRHRHPAFRATSTPDKRQQRPFILGARFILFVRAGCGAATNSGTDFSRVSDTLRSARRTGWMLRRNQASA
jgi:hypothetical protein